MYKDSFDKEIRLVRLPRDFSRILDELISEFVGLHSEDGMKSYQKWHGADLWMIYADSTDSDSGFNLTHRVTIGGYSDDPDTLLFIPDIVITKSEGRYIMPPDTRVRNILKSGSIRQKTDEIRVYGKANGEILQFLDNAWKTAVSLSPKDATLDIQ